MEELITTVIRVVSGMIRYLLIELVVGVLIKGIGVLTLKVITLGKYPTTPLSTKAASQVWVAGVAVVVLMVMLAIWYGS